MCNGVFALQLQKIIAASGGARARRVITLSHLKNPPMMTFE
ncbi:hypothetical protein RCCS2_03142 [Roseobacter sp. CCS2]|nr:hypothetical protein RCCS2_03142 [Roseobacter sp. CCS2]